MLNGSPQQVDSGVILSHQGVTKLMGNAKLTLDDWFKQTLITTAVGPAGSDPDWLAQHAVDRNSTRQAAESEVIRSGTMTVLGA